MDELRAIAGAGGCQVITAAGTYATSAGTLISGVRSIIVVSGATAITALQTQALNGTSTALPALNNIVGVDLSDVNGEILTFVNPISTITVAASTVIIAYGG